jgi:hypothetical protein
LLHRDLVWNGLPARATLDVSGLLGARHQRALGCRKRSGVAPRSTQPTPWRDGDGRVQRTCHPWHGSGRNRLLLANPLQAGQCQRWQSRASRSKQGRAGIRNSLTLEANQLLGDHKCRGVSTMGRGDCARRHRGERGDTCLFGCRICEAPRRREAGRGRLDRGSGSGVADRRRCFCRRPLSLTAAPVPDAAT